MDQEHLDPATEELWQEFHRVVNMNGNELRTWLLTDASGQDVFGPDPDLDVSESGRRILHVVDKRRVDLTQEDVRTMQQVVDSVRDRLATPRPEDDTWRRELMRLGHDPLKADSPRPDEDPDVGG
ncbi:hypothetical protein HDA32_003364 [Spinactinospora alkalitolerans]|uniref:DUF3140 domain-containing protein n=1 Tax=Spinactinospora alkalitolerans TaxID=687207 RepID=A0A852U270_9ACTN|nr:DUF3140 domain-containing protein [Spinactinospora alkalitolerans]NYE48244.1 hypothetical protein [Spinactinospora alkalitolerans]